MHVVPTVDFAVKAEKAGVSAVIAEGSESGGMTGKEEISTLVLVPQVVDAVKVPVIAAGGIGDGRGLAAALALGACAVQMGTAFMATEECEVSPAFKEILVMAKETDAILIRGDNRSRRVIRDAFIGEAFHVDAKDVDAYVVGEHGETMVPITTGVRVRGIPLVNFPGYDSVLLDRVVGDVIRASGEVISLKGGTVFAPATAANAVLESIVRDSNAVLPVCTYNQDFGVAVSLPTIVNRAGAGKAFSIDMSAKEEALLAKSVDNIKAFVADMKAGMGG